MFRERSGNALRTLRGCSEEMHNCFVLAFLGSSRIEDPQRTLRGNSAQSSRVVTRSLCHLSLVSLSLSLIRTHTRAASDTLLYGNVYF